MMNPADRTEFFKALAATGDLYQSTISENASLLYWEALAEYDINAVKRALTRHLRHPDRGRFMPKPADIILQIEGSTDDQASVAWSQVIHAIGEVGGYESVRFSDRLIHRIIGDLGGWWYLTGLPTETLEFKRREFIALYRQYQVKPPANIPDHVAGSFEVNNESSGHFEHVPEPKLIGGNGRKALKE